MRVGRRISMAALNTNINADLVLGCGSALYANNIVVPTGCGVAAGFWFSTNKDQYLQLRGGALAAGGGAEMILVGGTYAGGAVGDVVFTVPNAAATVDLPVLTLEGKTDTPTINAQTRRITDIGQATTDMDAAPMTKIWTDYTPTLVWGTATPASLTVFGRYCQVGKIVFFKIYISSADSNACSSLTATLPVMPVNDGSNRYAVAAIEQYGAAGATYIDPLAYVSNTGAEQRLRFFSFQAATDGQAIGLFAQGQYEAP